VTALTARLEGSIVILEPLTEEHADELWEAAKAPAIWEWLAHIGSDREYFDRWLQMSLDAARAGSEGPFATRDRRSGALIGSSRYLNVRAPDRVVEIGWTWLTPSAWGTGANTEAKLLMLEHAFEHLDCVRVEFKTDARNRRSRAALAALPAKFEGVLRNHMTVPDIGLRDSAYFSVIEQEWPEVRSNLQRRLAGGGGDGVTASPEIVLRHADASAELDALEPLWNALQEHHAKVTPNLGPLTPKRDDDDSWRMRRAKYERWLGDPETFFIVAEEAGEPVGYAFVTVGPGYASWATGERLAELETLSVLPERRGAGIGAALLDAVWERIAQRGVDDLAITTTKTNVDTHHFYEQQGFRQRFVVYYGRRNRI
jgi:RimJ/RimL family protein N-acetyltransferase/ribosomal protein S18 acetylase RimI-like enzyme